MFLDSRHPRFPSYSGEGVVAIPVTGTRGQKRGRRVAASPTAATWPYYSGLSAPPKWYSCVRFAHLLL